MLCRLSYVGKHSRQQRAGRFVRAIKQGDYTKAILKGEAICLAIRERPRHPVQSTRDRRTYGIFDFGTPRHPAWWDLQQAIKLLPREALARTPRTIGSTGGSLAGFRADVKQNEQIANKFQTLDINRS